MKVVSDTGEILMTRYKHKGVNYLLIGVSSTGPSTWDALDTVKSEKTGGYRNFQRRGLATLDVEEPDPLLDN